MTVSRTIFAISLLSAFLFSCVSSKEVNKEITLPSKGEFFDHISEYGIFINTDLKSTHEDLVKYEVVNELFSDYAHKDRYVYLPKGSSATLKDDGFFDWPEGAMMVKNFGYSAEQIGSDRLMETRLLIKEEKKWKAISYVWNDEQTDAKISKVGDVKNLNLKHNAASKDFQYVVPNKNQCKSCHNNNEAIDPVGFKIANLDKMISRDGQTINQIEYLQSKNLISFNQAQNRPPKMVAYTDKTAPLKDRALAYLDINCGHCHRPEGPGNTSGLFLQYNETRTNHLGYCKGPVAAGKGSGGRAYDITPGSADASILYYRMKSINPGEMMPEIGRSLAHTEGLELIKEWIDSINYNCDTE